MIGAVSIAAASACARCAGTTLAVLPGEGAKALTTKIGKRQQIAQLVLPVVLIIMRGLSDSASVAER